MTRKRAAVLILPLLLLLSIITVIVILAIHREEEPLIVQDKFWYATRMEFQFSILYEGERHISDRFAVSTLVNPTSPHFDTLYTELVFVLSEEDAIGFPDNVIVAWPSHEAARGIIIGIHLAISGNGRISPRYDIGTISDEINLEDFGLTYPLTFEQLVDDWENVAELVSRISASTFGIIWGGAHDSAQRRGRTIMSLYNPMYNPILNYIIEMRFVFMSDADSLFVGCRETSEELLTRELVFVHNREEALEVPREIATAWPNADEVPWLERRIAGINSVVNRTADELMHRGRQIRDVINLEDFGLTYPITIEDTVDNWEGVARLWDALSYYEHRDINIAAAEE